MEFHQVSFHHFLILNPLWHHKNSNHEIPWRFDWNCMSYHWHVAFLNLMPFPWYHLGNQHIQKSLHSFIVVLYSNFITQLEPMRRLIKSPLLKSLSVSAPALSGWILLWWIDIQGTQSFFVFLALPSNFFHYHVCNMSSTWCKIELFHL